MSAGAKRVIITTGVWALVFILSVIASPRVAEFLMSPPQSVRVVNVVLSVATATTLAVRLNEAWDWLTRSDHVVRLGFIAFTVSAAYGSAIAFHRQTPTTPSALITTLACVLVLGGVAISSRD